MAFAGTWHRDGVDVGLGGAWHPSVGVSEACVVPGCSNLVGAPGDGCPDCRLAYGDRLRRPVRVAVRCWLCNGPALRDGAACHRCAEAVGVPGASGSGAGEPGVGSVLRVG